MKNLNIGNIRRHCGEVAINEILDLERECNVVLPHEYIDFIAKYNGARLISKYFDFYDNNRDCESIESVAFLNILQIKDDMESLLKQSTNNFNDPDVFKFYRYFDNCLIPFGETGGGDFICFDYRNNQKTNNPPITYWCHDAQELEGRTSFIANSFEEFINMLHECDDDAKF